MGTFAPIAPTHRVEPEEVAADTWLIHSAQDALGQPLVVYINSMVITGDEPVIVDTGTIANRKQWLDDVFSIVEPADVRWVFLSHDDFDHTGNLDRGDDPCPNATLVTNWAIHRAQHELVRLPARAVPLGQRRRVVRRRRPHAARRAAAELRLAHDPWPVRRQDRCVLGRRHLRLLDAGG